MEYLFIDANNLMHYLSKKERKVYNRADLVAIIDRVFIKKKFKINLYFDGFPNEVITSSVAKIIYSNNKHADNVIRNELEKEYYNPKKVTVITSDLQLQEIAKVNTSKVMSCEDFINKYLSAQKNFMGNDKDTSVLSVEEAKKLFGVE
ncbi:MAG TPA: NYN domain-containing protein [Ignavibacteriales bacterium]|nr:NYN domain-containing protein [Ignavibacteriales bacterium]HOL81430.1 NYN domain-containing protein [Ignavibacteriales bacterium]HOM65544.1 NYN domain-containing protein [Ignavibacteriales bacterium]HPD68161.1 NYN domain-containing protein [Ignavibacteriales bacterium]HPP34340.1 NYN domain-containing protein [Ignavibacteriales bacterium]